MSDLEYGLVMKVCELSTRHKVEFAFNRVHHSNAAPSWGCYIRDQLGNTVASGEGQCHNSAFDAAMVVFNPNDAARTPAQASAEIAMLKEQLAAAEAKSSKKS